MKSFSIMLKQVKANYYSEVDAIIYQYEEEDKFFAVGCWGGYQEPAFWQCFLEKQQWEDYIEGWVAKIKNFTVSKYQQFLELKVIEQPLQKGDILVSNHELEQSVQFFEVTEIKSSHIVEIKQLAVKVEETGYLTGIATPIRQEYLSVAELTRVERLPCVLLNNQQAYLWDSNPVACMFGQKVNPEVNC